MKPLVLAVSIGILIPAGGFAQTRELHAYFDSPEIRTAAAATVATPAGQRTKGARELMPSKKSGSFVNYLLMTRSSAAWEAVEALRLNKMIESAAAAGGTSVVSSAVAPAVLSAAIEYGSVLQETRGTSTTLRANLLGVGRMIFGSSQLPYCAEIDVARCPSGARALRAISGVVSFEEQSGAVEPKAAPDAPPSTQALLGDGFRVASWGVRWDLTRSGHLDDPKYLEAWTGVIGRLRGHPASEALVVAIGDFFVSNVDLYSEWESATVALLNDAPNEQRFYQLFEARLSVLADEMFSADPALPGKLLTLSRSYSSYRGVRDTLIREAQIHKASVEYTNHDPVDQPSTSNVRLIYSHQPTDAPALITVNAAVTLYNVRPATEGIGRLRDVQVGFQVDRRLAQVLRYGHAVATVAGYYQWMRSDATVDVKTTAAGSLPGLALPTEASAVLGTKGHLFVLQAKLWLPVSSVIKIPFSVTWANRRELIAERDLRGQIGLTFDLDNAFRW